MLWRRHQARRHLKHIAHPVLGDATHGKGPLNRDYRARFGLTRLALHARRLGLGAYDVTAPLPADLVSVLEALGLSSSHPEIERDEIDVLVRGDLAHHDVDVDTVRAR